MTFDYIVNEICERLNLLSDEAIERVGREVNIQHRYVTISCNLDTSRRITVQADTAIDSREVTFVGIEKIELLFDPSVPGQRRQIYELTYNETREWPLNGLTGGDPRQYAVKLINGQGVTIMLDREMSDVRTLEADAWAKIVNLSGEDEPLFPESFHSYLIERVIADELKRQTKPQEAREALTMAKDILGELRLFLLKSATQNFQQNSGSSFGRYPFRRRSQGFVV